MKRVKLSEKQFKTILIGIWCFSFGVIFAVGYISFDPVVNQIIYISPSVADNVTSDYSNAMVRDAIDFSSRYVSNEGLFKTEQYPGWLLWKDYESRVDNASYCYWILSYSFGI